MPAESDLLNDGATLSSFINAHLPQLRRLYEARTARSADATTVTEREFLALMAEVTASYTLRPVIVEIFRNVHGLERCVCAPRRAAQAPVSL
jgi:hypothetical protein